MHPITRPHLGPVILTVGVIAGLATLAASAGHDRRRDVVLTGTPAPSAAAARATPRACATPWGLCPLPQVRVGDPCGCPHPLHGVVRGRTIAIGGGVTPAIDRLRGDDTNEPPRRLGPRRDD